MHVFDHCFVHVRHVMYGNWKLPTGYFRISLKHILTLFQIQCRYYLCVRLEVPSLTFQQTMQAALDTGPRFMRTTLYFVMFVRVHYPQHLISNAVFIFQTILRWFYDHLLCELVGRIRAMYGPTSAIDDAMVVRFSRNAHIFLRNDYVCTLFADGQRPESETIIAVCPVRKCADGNR